MGVPNLQYWRYACQTLLAENLSYPKRVFDGGSIYLICQSHTKSILQPIRHNLLLSPASETFGERLQRVTCFQVDATG